MYSYVGAPDETSTPLPMYLYDDNPFNDVYYLLNRDVLFDRLKEVYEYSHTTPYAPGEDRRDDLYAWGSLYEYGEEKVLNTLDVYREPDVMKPADLYEKNALDNLEKNLISIIRAHPETDFILFIPPYSELEWYNMYLRGHLDFVLYIKEICAERLLELPNVTLYDFNTREEWVRDLRYYKDYSHYSPEINDAIAQAIANGENRVRDIYDIYEHNDLICAWVDEIYDRYHQ